MLIFKEFFKTHIDQNIHQNAPNCTKLFQNFPRKLTYAPEAIYATLIYVQL